MEKNEYYPLDYGRYDSVEKWSNFCSTRCRCFSECTRKGGFCSSSKRRLIQFRQIVYSDSLLLESCEMYGEAKTHPTLPSGGNMSRVPSFWRFPEGRGGLQPWRRKFWEHKK